MTMLDSWPRRADNSNRQSSQHPPLGLRAEGVVTPPFLKEGPMKTMSIRKSQVLASLLLFLTSAALAKTVQVGTCLPNSQTYSTISQAVSSVPPGSTVLVCPGTYPEQVTITQPLTLRGVQNGNAANPTIIVPAGGLTKTVATGVGNFYYQLLANNGTSGAVNVSNITVVGSGNGLPNAAPLAGVFYNNTSGTVSRMAIFNQLGTGVGD